MTTPSVPAQLQTALDELVMAHNTLMVALDEARLSTLHSTYRAAIKRILAFHDQTIKSLGNLLHSLPHQPTPTKY